MKTSNLRDLTEDELRNTHDETRKKLFDLRVSKSMGGTNDQPLMIRTVRRDLARIKTVMKERESRDDS